MTMTMILRLIYMGFALSFGRIGGYNTYGDLQRGARLIELQPTLYKIESVRI